MSKAAALPSTTSLSPKSARRMLVMYQLEQQANNYLANAIEHQNQQRYHQNQQKNLTDVFLHFFASS
jgi:hypothetical protein